MRVPNLGPRIITAVTTASLLLLAALAVMGCSSESTPEERNTVPVPTSDGGADADAAASIPDPNGGRDDDPASCFAACQNTGFSCQAKSEGVTTVTSAELTVDDTGCVGTLSINGGSPNEQLLAMKIDCGPRTVCVGAAPGEPASSCTKATFSAFSFGYTPSAGGPLNLCTRN